ncbi:MAG: hypothetical protein GEU83_04755 [Pseudonocardiaceae bacterium]|nr:hypothetical protein [Pseudonocardiaceae bacterium]
MTGRPTDPRDQLESTTAPAGLTASAAAAAPSDGASTPTLADAPPSKFTVLLDPEAAAGFDQLAVDIRRLIGRRVSKGDLVRALIALAADDPALHHQVLAELRVHPAT